MTVKHFNTGKGLYIFSFDHIRSEFHSHPAIEIVIAENGHFSAWTENAEFHGLTFAVIEANKKHKISATDCKLKVIMVEHHKNFLRNALSSHGIHIENAFHFQSHRMQEARIAEAIIQHLQDEEYPMEYDPRISAAISYLDKNDQDYFTMTKTLQGVTNLSESRLSHLFKQNTGISVKKYLVWTRLKSTIRQHLKHNEDLFSSLLNSGFYDHPHFSRQFKAMLGVKPSNAYNSRTVQVSASKQT